MNMCVGAFTELKVIRLLLPVFFPPLPFPREFQMAKRFIGCNGTVCYCKEQFDRMRLYINDTLLLICFRN